jgi:hypothetical protein
MQEITKFRRLVSREQKLLVTVDTVHYYALNTLYWQQTAMNHDPTTDRCSITLSFTTYNPTEWECAKREMAEVILPRAIRKLS